MKPQPQTSPVIAVTVRGRRLAPYEDFYHWVLTLSWLAFFASVAAGYVLTNVVFAFAYWLVPGSVANTDGFFDCYFFSVETFATIGYGEMSPVGRVGHVLMSVEAFLSILANATITGITFARLARPTAKVLFSAKAVIANRNGVPHLMFRMANWRRNQIAEAQLSVMILMREVTLEGEITRRPVNLKLVRDRNPMFFLTWTAFHPIDAESPFYGVGALDKLREMESVIFLTLTGHDESFSQTIYTRYRYSLDDIVYNARFADVLSGFDGNGTRVLDFDRFHEIEMLDPAVSRPDVPSWTP